MQRIKKKRRSSAEKLLRNILLGSAGLVVLTFALLYVARVFSTQPTAALRPAATATETSPAVEADEPKDASSQVNGKWYGLCPKNSIRSIADFRKQVQNDPVLARHFARFDWSKARAERLSKPVAAYLAYRKDNLIRYTSRRITLPAGDRYITDGQQKVRFFCGNDFVETPPPVVSQEQVDSPARPVEGDTVPVKPLERDSFPIKPVETMIDPLRRPPTEMVAGAPRQASSGASRDIIPFSPPGGVFRNTTSHKPPPPPSVPEPGTLPLIGTGILALALILKLRHRKN